MTFAMVIRWWRYDSSRHTLVAARDVLHGVVGFAISLETRVRIEVAFRPCSGTERNRRFFWALRGHTIFLTMGLLIGREACFRYAHLLVLGLAHPLSWYQDTILRTHASCKHNGAAIMARYQIDTYLQS